MEKSIQFSGETTENPNYNIVFSATARLAYNLYFLIARS